MPKNIIFISLSLVSFAISVGSVVLLTSEIKKRNRQILFTDFFIQNDGSQNYGLPKRITLDRLSLDLPVESRKLEKNIYA